MHDLTGIGLFVVAVVLLFLFDGILGLCAEMLVGCAGPRLREAPAPHAL